MYVCTVCDAKPASKAKKKLQNKTLFVFPRPPASCVAGAMAFEVFDDVAFYWFLMSVRALRWPPRVVAGRLTLVSLS
jgi:hypothetical protein